MKIYIISSVRIASEDFKHKLNKYTAKLERLGYEVYLPHRDTNQSADAMTITAANAAGMRNADIIHIFYDKNSKGSHFDLGFCYALNKPLLLIDVDENSKDEGIFDLVGQWSIKSEKKIKEIVHNKYNQEFKMLQREYNEKLQKMNSKYELENLEDYPEELNNAKSVSEALHENQIDNMFEKGVGSILNAFMEKINTKNINQ